MASTESNAVLRDAAIIVQVGMQLLFTRHCYDSSLFTHAGPKEVTMLTISDHAPTVSVARAVSEEVKSGASFPLSCVWSAADSECEARTMPARISAAVHCSSRSSVLPAAFSNSA